MKRQKKGAKTTREPARRTGRPAGVRGRCGECRRSGHNMRTCPKLKKKG